MSLLEEDNRQIPIDYNYTTRVLCFNAQDQVSDGGGKERVTRRISSTNPALDSDPESCPTMS
jgi:hypothetical protein